MIENRFSISEIITIVMSFVHSIEKTEIYGIEDDELDLPLTLKDNMNKIDEKHYKEFIDKISYIAEEVYKLKTGELNELNMIHAEIKVLAVDNLIDYLVE